jgi:hypothetical protein
MPPLSIVVHGCPWLCLRLPEQLVQSVGQFGLAERLERTLGVGEFLLVAVVVDVQGLAGIQPLLRVLDSLLGLIVILQGEDDLVVDVHGLYLLPQSRRLRGGAPVPGDLGQALRR